MRNLIVICIMLLGFLWPVSSVAQSSGDGSTIPITTRKTSRPIGGSRPHAPSAVTITVSYSTNTSMFTFSIPESISEVSGAVVNTMTESGWTFTVTPENPEFMLPLSSGFYSIGFQDSEGSLYEGSFCIP